MRFKDDWDDAEEDEPIHGAYAVVHSLPDRPIVACTVFSDKDMPLGHRQWTLRGDGIHVSCSCSRDGRPLRVKANADGTTEIAEPAEEECGETIAPEPLESIHEQMTHEIESFADDWDTRPIRYFFREGAKEVRTRSLKLAGLWLDEDALDYSAAVWYVAEGERVLSEIEEATGDLEKIKGKFNAPNVSTAFKPIRKES